MPALRQHTTLNYLYLNITTISTGILFIYVTFSVAYVYIYSGWFFKAA